MQFVGILMKLVAKVLQSQFVVSTQRFLCVYIHIVQLMNWS